MRRGQCLCKGRAGRDLDLAEEPVGTERRAELGPKHLQSYPAAMLQIFGEVDGSHAAATELALDPVATAQALETIEWSKTDSSVAEAPSHFHLRDADSKDKRAIPTPGYSPSCRSARLGGRLLSGSAKRDLVRS